MDHDMLSHTQAEQVVASAVKKPDPPANDENRFRLGPFIEKLVLLILGFALTTAVGAYLSNQFRTESTRVELEIAAMESDINRAVQAFEAISQLMDKRLFRMRRVHDVLIGAAAEEREQRLADYRTAFVEWNDNLNRIVHCLRCTSNPTVMNWRVGDRSRDSPSSSREPTANFRS